MMRRLHRSIRGQHYVLSRIRLIRFRTMMQIGAVVIYAPSPQVIRNTRWACLARLVERSYQPDIIRAWRNLGSIGLI